MCLCGVRAGPSTRRQPGSSGAPGCILDLRGSVDLVPDEPIPGKAPGAGERRGPGKQWRRLRESATSGVSGWSGAMWTCTYLHLKVVGDVETSIGIDVSSDEEPEPSAAPEDLLWRIATE